MEMRDTGASADVTAFPLSGPRSTSREIGSGVAQAPNGGPDRPREEETGTPQDHLLPRSRSIPSSTPSGAKKATKPRPASGLQIRGGSRTNEPSSQGASSTLPESHSGDERQKIAPLSLGARASTPCCADARPPKRRTSATTRTFRALLLVWSLICIGLATANLVDVGVDAEGAVVEPKKNGLFGSLWDTIKRRLESSSAVSQVETHTIEQNIKQQKLQAAASSMMRRNQLLRESITAHYGGDAEIDRELFVDSNGEKGEKMQCHFWRESQATYWSYRWCYDAHSNDDFDSLKMTLYQVRLEQQFISQAISLGTPILLKGRLDASQDPAHRRALLAVRAKLRDAEGDGRLRILGHGEVCGVGGMRLAAIVRRKSCGNGDSRLVTVSEDKPCQYVATVCMKKKSKKDVVDVDKTKKKASIADTTASRATDDENPLSPEEFQEILHMYGHTGAPTSFDRLSSLTRGLPPLPPSRRKANAQLIKEMFRHAYDGYMYHAFPASDLRPVTCTPAAFDLVELPGMTLVDSLDTLLLMKNVTEFARAVERLRSLGDPLFAVDTNVSLFETNIRVLGGLLSAHQLAKAMKAQVLNSTVFDVYGDETVLLGQGNSECRKIDYEEGENDRIGRPGECSLTGECLAAAAIAKRQQQCRNTTFARSLWKYDGFLLDLAQDLGERLFPAFDTPTGIPFGTVNLLTGVPFGETPVASLAGGGTLTMEMELLSRLTRDPKFGRAAKLATRALWMRGSSHKNPMYGKHICTRRGEWTETLSGIGSNSDSFYEYLLKQYAVFPERDLDDSIPDDFWLQTLSAFGAIHNHSRAGEWYGDTEMYNGPGGRRGMVFEALAAFWPGLQTLAGESPHAGRTLNSFCMARESVGFLPERFHYGKWSVEGQRHHLRPELLESLYYMHRNTKDMHAIGGSSSWQWASDFALHALQAHARTSCGYASIAEVSPEVGKGRTKARLMDEMPSFFLSETLKYLYLTFVDDADNILHNDPDREWVFTTEAHPVHFERPITSDDEDDANIRMDALKSDVVSMLRSRADRSVIVRSHKFDKDPWSSLSGEQWTEKSPRNLFVEQITPVVEHMGNLNAVRRNEAKDSAGRFGSSFTRPFLSPGHTLPELDTFLETHRGENDAYLTIGQALPKGHALRRSCPNYHDSRLMWIRALHGGGSMDYSDVYLSAAHDDDEPVSAAVTAVRHRLIGAVDALSLYSSGMHASELYDASSRSSIASSTMGNDTTFNDSAPGTEEFGEKNVIDLGGTLGKFEISAFPGGSGFFIQQTKSGETFVVTSINDGGSQSQVFMVNSGTDKNGVSSDRSVVIADLSGNSFACEIDLHLGHEIIKSYPCAPAIFGPTRISTLVESGDILLGPSSIRKPSDEDPHGCSKTASTFGEEDEDDEEGFVQMFHRGSCTFEDKISNAGESADAVIVINEQDDELFVMSSNGQMSDDSNYPVAILVTGKDGAEILDQADFLDAKVSLTRQISKIEKDESAPNNARITISEGSRWPVVKASSESLQIYSESGWGVHAVQQVSGPGNKVEWQLFLLQHSNR